MSAVIFDYDRKEGLSQFLRPVYFNNRVLVKYLYDDRVSVEFASETYGTLYLAEDHLAFGINSQGAVIAWLGDLLDLPSGEQFHWQSENITSQHDVKSEFFDAQINVVLTDPPVGLQAINAVDTWNAGFANKHGVRLYKPTSFEHRLEEVRRYKTIIIQREDDFVRYVSELNEIVNENVDTAALRAFLTAKSIPFDKGIKGNKLLEVVYRDVLGDTTNLIAPFFWLYDLRLWADHGMGDDKLKDVAANLGVANEKDYEAILTELMKRLRDAARMLQRTYG